MALPPIKYPLVNGNRQSWASCNLELAVEGGEGASASWRPRGWSEMNFERTREVGDVYGPHPDPLGTTRGQNKYTGSLKMYLAEWNYFVQEILGGPGYGDVFFRAVLTYVENGFDNVKVELRGCRMLKSGFGNSMGTDATQVELDLHPVKIIWNDQDDVSDPLAA
jgi:hypothetical protein